MRTYRYREAVAPGGTFTKKSRKRGSAAAKDCSGLLFCNTVTANSSPVSDFPRAGVINKDFSSCK